MPANLGNALSIEETDALVRSGQLETVLEENSRRILIDKMGLSKTECDMLRNIWEKMRNRRLSRRRAGKK
jgi:hypothetical protein